MSNSPAAAALYVFVTAAHPGRFSSNAFHLLAGALTTLTFFGFEEFGAIDAATFKAGLSVRWLNEPSCK